MGALSVQRFEAAVIAMREEIDLVLGDFTEFDWGYCDKPFSDEVLSFCGRLSRAILTDPRSKLHPDLATFGFFCRSANVRRIAERYRADPLRLGRGLVLHVAPGNIPINYAFSWIFSVLAGNANIVRLPSRWFPQVDLANEFIRQSLAAPEFRRLEASTLFFRSPREHAIIDQLMAKADGLMIWGGDKTVEHFRTKKRKPRCVELSFSDRYSACLISADSILELNTPGLSDLAHKFFNDTFLVDQNACSSPRLVYWLGGEAAVGMAQEKFWSAVEILVRERYALNGVSVVDKVIDTTKALERYPAGTLISHGNYIYRLNLAELDCRTSEIPGRFGLFVESSGPNLLPFMSALNERYQTITTFGVDAATLVGAVQAGRVRGVDRVVPIGAALDISELWDGYDIIRSLSRLINS